LELGGLIAVGVGIQRRRRHHGHQLNLGERVMSALTRRPDTDPGPPGQGSGVVDATLPALKGEGRAVVTDRLVLPDAQEDPAAFADAVAEHLRKLNVAVKDAALLYTIQEDRHKKAVETVRAEIGSSVEGLREEDRVNAVFGVGWDVIGWVMLMIGVTVSSIASIAAV